MAKLVRSFYARLYGGILLTLLPFIVGAITAGLGVKTVPGWSAVAYIAVSVVFCAIGSSLIINAERQ